MRDLLGALHLYFIAPVLTAYLFALLAYIILGWLLIGGVIDNRNQVIRSVYDALFMLIEPVARPIRRFVPPLGGLDFSVLIIALAIPFLREWLLPRLISAIPF